MEIKDRVSNRLHRCHHWSKLDSSGWRHTGTLPGSHNLFDVKWPGKFELVAVVNFEEKGAFDEVFKGAPGVIYVSTSIIFHPDPANVVDRTVKSTINTLEAAAKAGVQRYVLSSSSKAVETTKYDNTPCRLTAGIAGRNLAELSFWSCIENNPPFVANCVVPDGNFGRGLNGATSTNKMLKAALAGEWSSVPMPIGFLIDVQDMARLLVAATAKPSLPNECIFAHYKHFTWDDLREKIREIRPEFIKGDDQRL